jgi:hypothetical protein
MKGADARMLLLALRAWLEGESEEEAERNARRLVELTYAKALAGHFAYFRLLLDLGSV